MIICKNLNTNDIIENIEQWKNEYYSNSKKDQWKNGRSALETARIWLNGIPDDFLKLLKDFNLSFKLCSPEFVTHFDKYGGNGRNHDLLIIAENLSMVKIVISIESKVDEPFSDIISTSIKNAEKELKKNTKSNALKRIQDLRKILFGSINDEHINLRYQLLTASAGVIAEANKQNSKKAFLIIQTIITDKTNKKSYENNQKDLNDFIKQLTLGKHKEIIDGEIIGPLNIPGNDEYILNNIDLWIGKYSIDIR